VGPTFYKRVFGAKPVSKFTVCREGSDVVRWGPGDRFSVAVDYQSHCRNYGDVTDPHNKGATIKCRSHCRNHGAGR
jgi:hypothetical protein